jgi:hypothetical protein
MDTKTAFLDGYVRPYPGDQFGLGDDLTGIFEQSYQNVVGSAAQWKDLARLAQRALGYIQLEWAKPKPDCTR